MNDRKVSPDEVVNTVEIADRLGVTASAVSNWIHRGDVGFPPAWKAGPPAWKEGQSSRGGLWVWEEVLSWFATHEEPNGTREERAARLRTRGNAMLEAAKRLERGE